MCTDDNKSDDEEEEEDANNTDNDHVADGDENGKVCYLLI